MVEQSHIYNPEITNLPFSEALTDDLIYAEFTLQSKEDLPSYLKQGIEGFKEAEKVREAVALSRGQQEIDQQIATLPEELQASRRKSLRRELNTRLTSKFSPGYIAADEILEVHEWMRLELVRHKDFPNPVMGFAYRILRDEEDEKQREIALTSSENRIYFSTDPEYEQYRDVVSTKFSNDFHLDISPQAA